ncbi:protein kinase domain-containing protein, partial [Nitrosomonas nitrosa]|uniref:protein kinase domain-containing protein n=1 Tax=Nitrosomonas nitrosa TaxID=52442 RepID=UPI0023F7B9BD
MEFDKSIRTKLKQFLWERFDLNELKDLAFDLGVDFELFTNQNKLEFCREFIQYFERRQKTSCLIAEIVKYRHDEELVHLLTELPPCKPQKKVQIIVSKGIRGDLTALRKELASKFQVTESEVTIIGAAWGSMRLLISVPDEMSSSQILSKIGHLFNGEYPIVAIDRYDNLDTANKTAWRYIVRDQPPTREGEIIRPAVAWKEALEATGGIASDNLSDTMPERIGRYTIIEKLGIGGMAIVYLAHDPISDRDVAVKVIKDKFADDPNFRQRFQREIKFIAKLEHPAVVPVYDVGEHEDKLFLVMRIMTGGSLRDRLEKEGSLPISDVSSILKRLAAALETAHKAKVIHRDIKPGNVLLDREGNTYLADFGIASAVEQASIVASTLIGTPGYMAPEQWSLNGIGPYTDIYQLGVMVFEMLTGRRPFTGENQADQHINQSVPSARTFNRKLPLACDAVFEKALAKDPSNRFKTPGEFAVALSRALGEEKIGNRYEIKEEIGDGRMARVYSAYDPQFVQEVAVKFMKYELKEGLAYQRRFNREARSMTTLSHDTIVPVYDVNLDNHKPYIAMRMMRGGSLRSRLSDNQPVQLSEVFRIAKRVALAIDTLHAENFIHRDIKPENVLFDRNDMPYLADFGLVEIAEQTQMDDHLLLSLPYLAPEQWLGQVMDKQTDIYQFGVMLFEILTGQLPFIDNTITGFRHKHLEEDIPSAHQINSNLPPAFDMVFAKAMSKVPEHRYSSAGELTQTLIQVEKQFILDTAYTEGREFYRNDQWQEAIDSFERVSKVDPDYLDTRMYLIRANEHKNKTGIYNRGKAAYDDNRWQDAIYQFQQIAGYRDAEILLAKARRQIELEQLYETALKNVQEEQWMVAKSTFNQIDRLDPNYKDVDERLKMVEQTIMGLYQKGQAELKKGNLETAVQWFEKISGHSDADKLKIQTQKEIKLGFLYEHGLVAFESQNWNEAEKTFNQILDLVPDYNNVIPLLQQIKDKKSGQ